MNNSKLSMAFSGLDRNGDWHAITCSAPNEVYLYFDSLFENYNDDLLCGLNELSSKLDQNYCPEELQPAQLYYDCDDCMGDTVSLDGKVFGFVELNQFISAVNDFKRSLKDGIWVSQDFYERFNTDGGKWPDAWMLNGNDFKVVDEGDEKLLELLNCGVKRFKHFANYFCDRGYSNIRICGYF